MDSSKILSSFVYNKARKYAEVVIISTDDTYRKFRVYHSGGVSQDGSGNVAGIIGKNSRSLKFQAVFEVVQKDTTNLYILDDRRYFYRRKAFFYNNIDKNASETPVFFSIANWCIKKEG